MISSSIIKNTLVMLLAGGRGQRLMPLTEERAKPAVPFGGIYRIIDFTLSNCINSKLTKIYVVTQYKSMSLNRHIKMGYGVFNRELYEFIDIIPPQLRVGDTWYLGTADAIYQNLYTIKREDPEYVVILSGDHIYKMDYSEMLDQHIENKADITIACMEVPNSTAAGQLGVVDADDSDCRINGFREKPSSEELASGGKDTCFVSMGVYIFNKEALIKEVEADAKLDTKHDFGKDIIPTMIDKGQRVFAFPFVDDKNDGDGDAYWRDIGTIDAYWAASMDLCSVSPSLNLYKKEWPIRTYHPQLPPSKFVFAQKEEEGGRRGYALDSLICSGCIISGGEVVSSILSPRVRINSFSSVEGCVLMDHVSVGRYARLRNVIVDKDIDIPQHMEIGFDHKKDAERFTVSPGGVVVVSRNTVFKDSWIESK